MRLIPFVISLETKALTAYTSTTTKAQIAEIGAALGVPYEDTGVAVKVENYTVAAAELATNAKRPFSSRASMIPLITVSNPELISSVGLTR